MVAGVVMYALSFILIISLLCKISPTVQLMKGRIWRLNFWLLIRLFTINMQIRLQMLYTFMMIQYRLKRHGLVEKK